MAIDMELPWRQVSAKTGFQVDEAIKDMCRDIVNSALTTVDRIAFPLTSPAQLSTGGTAQQSSNDCFKDLLRRVQFFGCGVSARLATMIEPVPLAIDESC